MLNGGRFTELAQIAIKNAQNAATRMGHNYVGTEHLLLGLAEVEEGVASKALARENVDANKIEDTIAEITPSDDKDTLEFSRDFTPRTKHVLDLSIQEATRIGTSYVGTEHILIALLRDQQSLAFKILNHLKVNMHKLFNEILSTLGEHDKVQQLSTMLDIGKQSGKKPVTNTPMLDKFSKDFTQLAKDEKFDPIVGRDSEMDRLIRILSRRNKNNPCLVGDPGVGKTAVAEGLAQKIVSGDIPEILKDKKVVALDIPAMVAGSKYRGEFEDRIKKVMKEVKEANNIILFIDELHTIIGAGNAEGSIDASNILKPALARGEVQLIGATTVDEYRKYIEKDAALERRFQPVKVNEPSEEEAIQMLKVLRDKYEAHHSVKIKDSAIEASVKLSVRYITDRFLPDKAIDLLDEAASKIRLKTFTMPDDIKVLEGKLRELEKEKEAAIKTEEYEKAGVIKQKQKNMQEKLDKKKQRWSSGNTSKNQVVGEEEIADIVANWTGIPVRRLQEEETQKLLNMEKLLHDRVIGQDEAVTAISKAIRRGRVGLKNPKRPIGTFLFLGPTGVGKTELCKALAEVMFGSADGMIRIDMSEYMEKHSVSKLVGSPPGYVGHEEGGQLSEKVRRNPYAVVLFDEIEKANPEVFNILLQVMDDGHITDSKGRKVDFKNTVIIMTSNAGARSIIAPKKLGFSVSDDVERDYKEMKKNVMEEVKNVFKPEFLNRIDELIVFHPLGKDDITKIAHLMLNEVIGRVHTNMGINLTVTEEAISHIIEDGYSSSYGARPLRRAIQNKIEDLFADSVLEGKVKSGDDVIVDFSEGNYVIK